MTPPGHISRRGLLIGFAVALGLTRQPWRALGASPPDQDTTQPPRNGDDVLRKLLAGNQRFVKGQSSHPRRNPGDFRPLAKAQYPIAAVIACADARVTPEILFDVGIGDVFVVRVAGNVVGGTGAVVKGSIEYAVAELNVPLILVLGHGNCGAVKAAMKHIDANDSLPGAINQLVELVKPAVVESKGLPGDPLDNAIRANVSMGVRRLEDLQPIIAPRVQQRTVKVAGAHYDLRTGEVRVVD